MKLGPETLLLTVLSDDARGKENQSCSNSIRSNKGQLVHKSQSVGTPMKRPLIDSKPAEKRFDPQKLQA